MIFKVNMSLTTTSLDSLLVFLVDSLFLYPDHTPLLSTAIGKGNFVGVVKSVHDSTVHV